MSLHNAVTIGGVRGNCWCYLVSTHPQSLVMHSHALPHPCAPSVGALNGSALLRPWQPYDTTPLHLPHQLTCQGQSDSRDFREYEVNQVLWHQRSPALKSIGGEQEGGVCSLVEKELFDLQYRGHYNYRRSSFHFLCKASCSSSSISLMSCTITPAKTESR